MQVLLPWQLVDNNSARLHLDLKAAGILISKKQQSRQALGGSAQRASIVCAAALVRLSHEEREVEWGTQEFCIH